MAAKAFDGGPRRPALGRGPRDRPARRGGSHRTSRELVRPPTTSFAASAGRAWRCPTRGRRTPGRRWASSRLRQGRARRDDGIAPGRDNLKPDRDGRRARPELAPGESELAALELNSGAKAFAGPACRRYREAWRAARRAVVERDTAELYDTRPSSFAASRCFAALKEERSGLDFEDLELEAVRLLRERPAIGDVYRSARHVMVDEFQDTNELQLALTACCRARHPRVRGRRRVPVDLRVPPRRPAGVPARARPDPRPTRRSRGGAATVRQLPRGGGDRRRDERGRDALLEGFPR